MGRGSGSQGGGNKEAKRTKFFAGRTFLTPWYACVFPRTRSFYGKFILLANCRRQSLCLWCLLLLLFLIFLNSTQAAISTIETEMELKALLERSFFCRSVYCSILRTLTQKFLGQYFQKDVQRGGGDKHKV